MPTFSEDIQLAHHKDEVSTLKLIKTRLLKGEVYVSIQYLHVFSGFAPMPHAVLGEVKLEMIGDHRQLQPSTMQKFAFERRPNKQVFWVASPQIPAIPVLEQIQNSVISSISSQYFPCSPC